MDARHHIDGLAPSSYLNDPLPIAKPPVYAQFMVPQRYVKLVKTSLESHNLLVGKIIPHNLASKAFGEPHMSLFTNILLRWEAIGNRLSPSAGLQDEESLQILCAMFAELGLPDKVRREIKSTAYAVHDEGEEVGESNIVLKGVRKGLEALPKEMLLSIGLTVEGLVNAFPTSYTIYRPMVLLPHNAFTSPHWIKLVEAHLLQSPNLQSVWKEVAASVGVTHIAINAGIPLQTTSAATTKTTSNENILRSPTNLTPIYGSFGPPPSTRTISSPTASDFDDALWVTHIQNGIHQTWAPLYTMFSRGNIREKTRLLTLPSVTVSVQHPSECTAVDLYAGIGYFAFSYKKAGVSKVLCWELNWWSIEGLRRGAKMNGWKSEIFRNDGQIEDLKEESDFLVFAQSNEYALDMLPRIRQVVDVPPIRHVNLGFLPSSKLSWGVAVGMVDRELGGWMHAHENVGVNEVEERKMEVVTEMEEHLDRAGLRGEVRCEHVERVKTYAPGVLHVVFDIWIGPTQSLEGSGI